MMLTGIQLKEKYRFNTTLGLTLDGAAYHGGGDSNVSGDLKTRLEASPGLSYQFNRSLALNAKYRYRQETLCDRAQDAQSHTALLGLTFKP